MAGTRTAPTVSGTPTLVQVSIGVVDARGDRRSLAFLANGTEATPANIEAVAVAYQAASNASLWQVQVTDIYRGLRLASNAEDEVFASADDALLISYQNASGATTRYADIRAPLGELILGGERVDTDNALYTAYRDAVQTLMGAASFSPISTRFTEHVNRNQKIPAS